MKKHTPSSTAGGPLLQDLLLHLPSRLETFVRSFQATSPTLPPVPDLATQLWLETQALLFRLATLLFLRGSRNHLPLLPADTADRLTRLLDRLPSGPHQHPGQAPVRAMLAASPPSEAFEESLLEPALRTLLLSSDVNAPHVLPFPHPGGWLFAAPLPLLQQHAWGEVGTLSLLQALLCPPLPARRTSVRQGPPPIPLETAPENLGRLLEALLPFQPSLDAAGLFQLCRSPQRRQDGAFYTPQALVTFLVRTAREALPPTAPSPPSVLDTALGTGPFLLETLRQLAPAPSLESPPDPRRDRVEARLRLAEQALHGVDRDPRAVELARLILWLEAHAGAQTVLRGHAPTTDRPSGETFLGENLFHGDALSGPRLSQLAQDPQGGPPDPHRLARLTTRWQTARDRSEVRLALQRLCQAWSQAAGEGGRDPALLEKLEQATTAFLEGTGPKVEAGPRERAGLEAPPFLSGGTVPRLPLAQAPALSFEAAFPAFFQGNAQDGFLLILGNPPWESLKGHARELLAPHDPALAQAPTRRERSPLEATLRADPAVAARMAAREDELSLSRQLTARLYPHQRVLVDGDLAGRQPDAFRLFMERHASLLAPGGVTGVVVPSAFHANEGATGVRRLYFQDLEMKCLYSFENRRKLFPIDSRFKLDLVVAARTGRSTEAFPAAFYQQDPAWLDHPTDVLPYSLALAKRTGGPYLSLLEARSPAELRLLERCLAGSLSFAQLAERLGLHFGRALDMTNDAHRFEPTETGGGEVQPGRPDQACFPLLEGKHIHQYTHQWGPAPRYQVRADRLMDRPQLLEEALFFRLAFRAIARSNDARTALFCLIPPGVLTGNSLQVERRPGGRPLEAALLCLALGNSLVFDWLLRQRAAANVNRFLLELTPAPARLVGDGDRVVRPWEQLPEAAFLVEAARALSGLPSVKTDAHVRLAKDRRQRLEAARQGEAPLSALRGEVDAVVARAFGLSPDDFSLILQHFSPAVVQNEGQAALQALETLPDDGGPSA